MYQDNLIYEKFDVIEKDLDDMRVEIKNNIGKLSITKKRHLTKTSF
jgi:hypothetical protein